MNININTVRFLTFGVNPKLNMFPEMIGEVEAPKTLDMKKRNQSIDQITQAFLFDAFNQMELESGSDKTMGIYITLDDYANAVIYDGDKYEEIRTNTPITDHIDLIGKTVKEFDPASVCIFIELENGDYAMVPVRESERLALLVPDVPKKGIRPAKASDVKREKARVIRVSKDFYLEVVEVMDETGPCVEVWACRYDFGVKTLCYGIPAEGDPLSMILDGVGTTRYDMDFAELLDPGESLARDRNGRCIVDDEY